MVFQSKAVQSLILKQAKKTASKTTTSRSLSAVPVSSEATSTATTTIEESFAFYPVQKNRIQSTNSSLPSVDTECFSYYPSTGVTERKVSLREATAAYASKPMNHINQEEESILNDPKIQQRLNDLKTQKTAIAKSSSSTTSVEDSANTSFAFYPVQKHRIQTQTIEEPTSDRECFSFYPSTSNTTNNTSSGATTLLEDISSKEDTMMTPDKTKEIHFDETDSAIVAMVEKKGISFETATPSPTSSSFVLKTAHTTTATTPNWETVMQALKKVTSTTAVLP